MFSRTPKTEHRKSNNVFAVILVGGKGKRLRPLSTDIRPKAFLSVTRDRKTIFRNTLDRIAGFIDDDNITVVANEAHSKLVKRDFRNIGKRNLILEPVSRNTAPAIALAAHLLKSGSGDGIMVVLPSDQYVTDKSEYLDAIGRGIDFVKNNNGAILTLGVKPEHASAQFGYIKIRSQKSEVRSIFKVEQFAEKPDLGTAKKYVKSGQYLWNTGAFIFKVSVILKAFQKFAPKIYAALDKLDKNMKNYEDMPDISIDYAIMEKARNIYCVKGAYGWNDIGSFESLISVLKRESRRFIPDDGKVAAIL